MKDIVLLAIAVLFYAVKLYIRNFYLTVAFFGIQIGCATLIFTTSIFIILSVAIILPYLGCLYWLLFEHNNFEELDR